jgi:hypothetical protein
LWPASGRLDPWFDQKLFHDRDVGRFDDVAAFLCLLRTRLVENRSELADVPRFDRRLDLRHDDRRGLYARRNFLEPRTPPPLGLPWSPCVARERGLTSRTGSRTPRTILAFQDPCPVELNVGVVLFDQPDGIFIERGSADAHAGRRPKPIEDARSRFSAASAPGAVRMHDKRVFVPAFVARKPQMRQNYFLFWVRVAVLRAGVFEREGEAFRAADFARRGAAARDRPAGRGAF